MTAGRLQQNLEYLLYSTQLYQYGVLDKANLH